MCSYKENAAGTEKRKCAILEGGSDTLFMSHTDQNKRSSAALMTSKLFKGVCTGSD